MNKNFIPEHKVKAMNFVKYCSNMLHIDFNNIDEVRLRMNEIGNLLADWLNKEGYQIDGFEIIEVKLRSEKMKVITLYKIFEVNGKKIKVIYGYVPAKEFTKFLSYVIFRLQTYKDFKDCLSMPFYEILEIEDDEIRNIKNIIIKRLKKCGITEIVIDVHDEGAITIMKPKEIEPQVYHLIFALFNLRSVNDLVEIDLVNHKEKYSIDGVELVVYNP